MDSPFYEFEILEEAISYRFESVGPNGKISKNILYSSTSIPDFYNLALGDVRIDGSLDIFSKTNNGDLEKIMATVIQTMLIFLNRYPNAKVFFTGSTPARTRLYQIVLAKEITKVTDFLTVLGLYDESLEPFEANKTYEAFVISKKNLIFDI